MTGPDAPRGRNLGGFLDLHVRARRNALRSLQAMQERRADTVEADRAVHDADDRAGKPR